MAVKKIYTGTTTDITNVFMKEAKILSEIKHDNIVALLRVCEKPEVYIEPFNADKKVSS